MSNQYDVGIVGAGLAGLALSILLSRKGHKVVLLEKHRFPYHKLCGEYLSNESVPFLESLGVDFDTLNPSKISRLEITSNSGKRLVQNLPLGGIGISRYRLDHVLKIIAENSGVQVCESTLVKEVKEAENQYVIVSNNHNYYVKLPILTYGKKSNLKKLNPGKNHKNNEYLGVKYHVKMDGFPDDLVQMNTFKNGYCGVCRVEDNWISLCYLTATENLANHSNRIKDMEKSILFQNPAIRDIFQNSEFVYKKPITVSNIDFYPKSLYDDNFIFCGDAAGLITPLSGNGMSIALHSAKILALEIDQFLNGEVTRDMMLGNFESEWRNKFGKRLKSGRMIQKLFRNQIVANFAIGLLDTFPAINRKMISKTHGYPF